MKKFLQIVILSTGMLFIALNSTAEDKKLAPPAAQPAAQPTTQPAAQPQKPGKTQAQINKFEEENLNMRITQVRTMSKSRIAFVNDFLNQQIKFLKTKFQVQKSLNPKDGEEKIKKIQDQLKSMDQEHQKTIKDAREAFEKKQTALNEEFEDKMKKRAEAFYSLNQK